ncbi:MULTISPECIES: NUDIX hydrolase [Shouchella]|uniref:NUDIX domain-containing protein n=2 Tax=Shouchella TaxID=2893057 RepID=A0ABY7W4M3_9BACI|nr:MULTISPECIES: NUDIX domain-containing protein [Shouchella]MED4129573.1 NUDIX domain-containing protein [Shouchella miscanthi]WDF02832.1 NUDIX domain-containing protein [Shouchella hunanensis]
MRNRGCAVLIKDQKVVLIKRVHNNDTYFVFPGGGVEKDETLEEATIREALEELNVHICIERLLTTVFYHGTHYFFLASILEGDIEIGQGDEYVDKERKRGTYEPVWVPCNQLSSLDVRPKEIGHYVQQFLGEF